ncbi:MAG: Gfo/Idh/MocA family protein [Solirubrobacteraceae bacterium]
MAAQRQTVRVGIVGSGFMLKAHTLAYRALGPLYGATLPPVELRRVYDVEASAAREAVERFGWRDAAKERRAVTQAEDIDLVDVVTPNDVHAEIAIDAARHGKHVLCEKPLANDLPAAREMVRAVAEAGIVDQVGFVYRRWPAVRLAKRLVDAGCIGRIRTFRGHYFHDYAADPALPLGWRGSMARAGAGSIGDIGSHVIDLGRHLVGELSSVSARSRTFITRRRQGGDHVQVDVDDATDLLVEFSDGASGVVQASWMATGYKTDLSFELTGDRGAIRFSWQRLNELAVYSEAEIPGTAGFRTIVIGPQHEGAEAFWPVAGQGLGWGDAFLLAARDLLGAVAGDEPAADRPSFVDGLRAMEVVAAAQESAAESRWATVRRMDP